jgi:DNA-nicking Smr family endonuclease
MKSRDLHGYTVQEALQFMDNLLGECRLKGGEHVYRIITGHGKIQAELAKYFKNNEIEYRFELGNNGAYMITIN